VAQTALRTACRVLVELVDEDDDLVDAEYLALRLFPDLGHDRADEQLLDVGVAAGDVDDADLLIGKRLVHARQVAVGDDAVGEQTAELGNQTVEPVSRLLDRELVVTGPVGGVRMLFEMGVDLGKEVVELTERFDAAVVPDLGDETPEFVVEVVTLEDLVGAVE